MIFQKNISLLDIVLFFRQFATLITAGVPIAQSCQILANNQEKIILQRILHSLKNSLESGKGLSTALRQYPNYFDALTCQLIQIGEQTGTLDQILLRIAHHKEKKLALNHRIKQILFYPLCTLLITLIVSGIMLFWIVPRFAELFQPMHDKLPWITRQIFFISSVLREHAWLMLIPILGLFLFFYYLKQSKKFRQTLDRFILKLPFIGQLLKKIMLARFSHTLTITLSAGMPILDILKMLVNLSHHHDHTKAMIKLQTEIARGQQLHSAMHTSSFFPAMMIQMVRVGEESGKLENMLEKMATLYETDADQLIARLSQLLEPLIMVILGVLIGGLVIAMYLPIFKLGTAL
jgi:type IV pilus assembly protein PilC